MRILVAGRSGQLATALTAQAAVLDLATTPLGRPELDLERPARLASRIAAERPDLVINAAAYTAVDRAESEPARAFAVNRDGAAALAAAASSLGLPFVHISTDYVFDGRKGAPYVETDATAPLNVYGHSKLAGEQAVLAAHSDALILRTSWVFSPFGSNFLKTMLRLGAERPVLRVVDDQFGTPTSATDLAAVILAIAPRLRREGGGLYHAAGAASTSWHDLAALIFAESRKHGGPAPRLEAIRTPDYPTPAQRPANSSLDSSALADRFGTRPRPWTETVREVMARTL